MNSTQDIINSYNQNWRSIQVERNQGNYRKRYQIIDKCEREMPDQGKDGAEVWNGLKEPIHTRRRWW
jgi:hypothetical protein